MLAIGMLIFYAAIVSVSSLRAFFELSLLRSLDYLLLGCVALVWALLLRLVWRARLLERLLQR